MATHGAVECNRCLMIDHLASRMLSSRHPFPHSQPSLSLSFPLFPFLALCAHLITLSHPSALLPRFRVIDNARQSFRNFSRQRRARETTSATGEGDRGRETRSALTSEPASAGFSDDTRREEGRLRSERDPRPPVPGAGRRLPKRDATRRPRRVEVSRTSATS